MRAQRSAAAGALVLLCLGTSPAPAFEPPDWRAFDRAGFAQAREQDRHVLFLLTAPWNRDHFVLTDEILSDPSVAERVHADYVPLRADLDVFPELGLTYRLDSGLVPSIHVLDAKGGRLASLPPLESAELIFYLDELRGDVEPLRPPPPPDVYEVNGRHLASRIARLTMDRLQSREAYREHEDWDVESLVFLVELAGVQRRPETRRLLDREIRALLTSPLADPIQGGFHRAYADREEGIVHHEKLLRPNMLAGSLLASWTAMTGAEPAGVGALLVLRFLNQRLRVRGTTLYAGSIAADVYDDDRRRVVVPGRAYYRMKDRSEVPDPPVSDGVPVGANFVFHEAMLDYYRIFQDVRMLRAARRGVPHLLDGGFEEDGSARRSLGVAGVGNLRDQADAGSGLLAYYALTGDQAALAAAERLARTMVRRFWDESRERFRNVAFDSDLPDAVRNEASHAGWNGGALRFLVDLGSVVPEQEWRELVGRSLDSWAAAFPWNAVGISELGRAALRTEEPVPVLVIAADPASPEGERLRDDACLILDRTVRFRWIDPGDERTARELGVELEEEPAIYLVWDGATPAIRDPITLKAAFDHAIERIRERPRAAPSD